jgi:hypothetical protein
MEVYEVITQSFAIDALDTDAPIGAVAISRAADVLRCAFCAAARHIEHAPRVMGSATGHAGPGSISERDGVVSRGWLIVMRRGAAPGWE